MILRQVIEEIDLSNHEKVLEIIKFIDTKKDDLEDWHDKKDELMGALAIKSIKNTSYKQMTESDVQASEKIIEWIKDNKGEGWYG